ncbi:hypothetical protein SUDANB145_00668 [Streptomyces sp. enrichment culture]
MTNPFADEEAEYLVLVDARGEHSLWPASARLLYGDISTPDVARTFSETLRTGCAKLGIDYYDLNPVVADAVTQKDWIFVDRAHYTDHGYDLVAGIMADPVGLTLQEARVVHDQHSVGVTEVVDHVPTHVVEYLVGVPPRIQARADSRDSDPRPDIRKDPTQNHTNDRPGHQSRQAPLQY